MEGDGLVGRERFGSQTHVAKVVPGLGVVGALGAGQIVEKGHDIAFEGVNRRIGVPSEHLLADAVFTGVKRAREATR